MPRYTRKPKKRGLSARSTKRTSSSRKPLSSAPKKQNTYATGATTKAPTRKAVGTARGAYARQRTLGGRISLWFKVLRALSIKYQGWFIAGYVTLGVLLLTGAFFLFFFKDGQVTFVKADASPSPSVSASLTEADDPFLSIYTDEELAGLNGTGLESDEYDDLLEDDKVSIGVFIGEVTPDQVLMLQKLDEAIDIEYANETVGGVHKYYSNDSTSDNFSAQIQGIRSLANRDVKAVVVCINDEDEYTSIVNMAKENEMRVVAVDAPVDYGYDINIVTDNNDYGISIAEFIGDNVSGRANLAEFVDTSDETGNSERLSIFNTKASEYSNLNILSTVDVGSGKSISRGMSGLLEEATIEAIYTDSGLATDVLKECIDRQTFPKVFIGDASAGFIKLWYALMTTGVDIKVHVDPDDSDSETITQTVQGSGMQVYIRPTPEGAAATAVKFAVRLAEGKTLKTDMLTENKVFYYTGNVAVTEAVMNYYYNLIKDKDDDFLLNDWVSDYEVDLYFDSSGRTYYTQITEAEAVAEPTPSASPEASPSASPESSASPSPTGNAN